MSFAYDFNLYPDVFCLVRLQQIYVLMKYGPDSLNKSQKLLGAGIFKSQLALTWGLKITKVSVFPIKGHFTAN